MFKKHTLAGESNPSWQVAEPALLKIWARAMEQVPVSYLYLCSLVGLAVSSFFFIGNLLFRAAIVGAIIFALFLLFDEIMVLAFASVFSTLKLETAISASNVSFPWVYQLLGYVILIKAVVTILGTNFTQWVSDSFFHLLFMVTGMRPVKWLARLLLKENYWAQSIAKSPFMAVYMAGSMPDTPRELRRDYDQILRLYKNSNEEDARRELEKLCGKY